MSIPDIAIAGLTGSADLLGDHRGSALLITNVASRCSLSGQYAKLQWLHETYGKRGLTVIGVPCNQFGNQEPGTPEQIADHCAATWAVTFPLTEKVEVNGAGRHPLFAALTAVADDADGHDGDVRWNFEKFLVDAEGKPVARFGSMVEPDDPALVGRLEELLPGNPPTGG
jgi:glutathione peroxidase